MQSDGETQNNNRTKAFVSTLLQQWMLCNCSNDGT